MYRNICQIQLTNAEDIYIGVFSQVNSTCYRLTGSAQATLTNRVPLVIGTLGMEL